MLKHRFALACPCLLICTAAAALAGPFDKGRVAADATWVFHADVENIKRSPAAAKLLEPGDDDTLKALHKFRDDTGIDLQKDLLDVTVFGVGADPASAVMVASLTEAADQLNTLHQRRPEEVTAVEERGRTILVCRTDGVDRFATLVRDAAGRRLAVAGESRDAVHRAADVIAAASPSLSGSENPLAVVAPTTDAMIFFAVENLASHADANAASMILQYAQRVVVEWGQVGQNFYIDATMTAQDEPKARNMSQAMQGAIAMGRMFADADASLTSLHDVLDRVTIEGRDKDVRLRCTYDSRKSVDLIESVRKSSDAAQ